MNDVIIIGGGIAGLTAALQLRRLGRTVALFEASSRAGGAIQTVQDGEFLLECGPNTIQRSTPRIEELIRSLDLESDVITAPPAAAKRFIVRGGRPVEVPSSPAAAITTSLLSWRARAGILGEPFRRAMRRSEDESVADFVRRRLGREVLDYTVDPFVAGVYAGDPERLSIHHAFPRMRALEAENGSLILGAVRTMRRRRALPRPMWKMFSFRNGISVLPDRMVDALGASVSLSHEVEAIRRLDDRWEVTTSGGATHGRALITSVPLHRLRQMSIEPGLGLGAAFGVAYPPLAVVHSAYRRTDVGHPLDGFGMLTPSKETSIRILGTLFSSSLFPGRAPEDVVLLTTFIGGRRSPGTARASSDELLMTAHSDLSRLLRIRDVPIYTRVKRWAHAIPQYELGYGAVMAELRDAERSHPGLFFAGNYVDGVSVTDTIDSGFAAAEKADAFLSA